MELEIDRELFNYILERNLFYSLCLMMLLFNSDYLQCTSQSLGFEFKQPSVSVLKEQHTDSQTEDRDRSVSFSELFSH